jgi:hypothetical protein
MTTALHAARPEIPMPAAVARLDTDKHGRPIPWFVAWIDGQPDFRIIRTNGVADALRYELCWVCGQSRGRHAAFVIGPMCAVNRITAEPPSHLPCAVYSARACPFLSTPTMHRRDRGLTEKGAIPAAGTTILRNPGVALVWSSRTWHTFTVPTSAVKAGLAQPGSLIDVGEPTSWSWWAEGRPATHDEVDASIQSGMPLLMDQAVAQGTGAVAELARMAQAVLPLLPEPVPA